MQGTNEIRRLNLRVLIDQRFQGSQTKFAAAMGYAHANFVSRLLSDNPKGAKAIGERTARRIESLAGIPANWLDQPHHTQQPGSDYNVSPGPPIVRRAPLISWVQAGDWQEVISDLTASSAEEWYPCPVTCSPETFVLRVRGASMEPKFRDGELIFVDPHAEARHRSFVVVRMDEEHEATFKQLVIEGSKRYLKPLNPQWPDPIIEINGRATICGVVIFRGEKL